MSSSQLASNPTEKVRMPLPGSATPLVAQVAAGAKTPDDKYHAATFRLNLEQLKLQAAAAANPNAPHDNTPLIAPLDALIASTQLPASASIRSRS